MIIAGTQMSLSDIADGGLQKKFDDVLQKVLANMADPETAFDAKREINIKIRFEQNLERNVIWLDMQVTPKLASKASIGCTFDWTADSWDGEMTLKERKAEIDGQISTDDLEEDEDLSA